jgi:hypothetical protein
MTKSVFTSTVAKCVSETPVKALIKHQVPLLPCITIGTQISAQKQIQPHFRSFLGAFAKLRKSAIRIVMSVCPSAWNKSDPSRRIFMKFDI